MQEISRAIKDGKLSEKVYRGDKNYASYVNLNEEALRKKRVAGTLGQLKRTGKHIA